jgi:ubiquinone/menaquinone biosynthesis C-methylase UbiE
VSVLLENWKLAGASRVALHHALKPMEERSERDQLRARGRLPSTAGFVGAAAEKYAQGYTKESAGGYALRARRKKVLELFDKPGGKVLDVGCGPAPLAQDLVNLGCEFWGVDPSEKMIEICRDRFGENKKVHFLLGEAERLCFPDSFFDAVLCIGVFDGLPHGAQALREMLRVLKPRGTLIMSFANLRSPYAWWKACVFYPALCLARRSVGRDTDHSPIFVRRHLYSQKTASQLVSKAGTRVERVIGYYYNILLSPLDELWPAAALWLVKKLEEDHPALPSWLPVGFILKATKV